MKAGGAGRDPESIENIRVRLAKDGKGDSVKLGDAASVVPRGKNVLVIVGEKDVSSMELPEMSRTGC